jgi:CheY-like chemotaxis protein
MAGETSAHPLRILVADDRRDAGHIMKVLLERSGHEVVVVENLQSALDSARQFRPHAIISDIALESVRDGCELARSVTQDPTPKPCLIALTGYDDEDTRRDAIEAGFDHFLVKPPAIQELLGILARVKA